MTPDHLAIALAMLLAAVDQVKVQHGIECTSEQVRELREVVSVESERWTAWAIIQQVKGRCG